MQTWISKQFKQPAWRRLSGKWCWYSTLLYIGQYLPGNPGFFIVIAYLPYFWIVALILAGRGVTRSDILYLYWVNFYLSYAFQALASPNGIPEILFFEQKLWSQNWLTCLRQKMSKIILLVEFVTARLPDRQRSGPKYTNSRRKTEMWLVVKLLRGET